VYYTCPTIRSYSFPLSSITLTLFHKVKDMVEFERLIELPCLEDLHFVGNPLEDRLSKEGKWRSEVGRILPKLKRLDGKIQDTLWSQLNETPAASSEPPVGAPPATV
jgi:hypothetical protein